MPVKRLGLPWWLRGKKSAANADLGLTLGSGRSSGEGNGYPLQYSCLRKSHGQRRVAGYSPWGHKSWIRLGDSTTTVSLIMLGT